MSDTYKDKKDHVYSKMRLAKKLKQRAKKHKKRTEFETNPRFVKLKSADKFDYI